MSTECEYEIDAVYEAFCVTITMATRDDESYTGESKDEMTRCMQVDEHELEHQIESLMADRVDIEKKMIDLIESQIAKLVMFRESIDKKIVGLLQMQIDNFDDHVIKSPLYDDIWIQYIEDNKDLASLKRRMTKLHGDKVGCLAEESIIMSLNIEKWKDRVRSIKQSTL